MARRKRDETQCTCPGRPASVERETTYGSGYVHRWTEHPNHCGCEAVGLHGLDGLPTDGTPIGHHHYGCPRWDGPESGHDSGNGFRPFSVMIGSRRMPFAKWAKRCTPYPWQLWRNFVFVPFKVETGAQILKRQLSGKPAGYSWPLAIQTAAEREAAGYVPGRSHAEIFGGRFADMGPAPGAKRARRPRRKAA